MKLIIVRHGETEENIKGIIQGHLPGHLSKLGIKQAKKVGARLKNEKFDFIYSSDLDRAVDTLKEITKFHSKIPVQYVKELREIYFAKWEGKSHEELGLIDEERFGKEYPKDAETEKDLFNRVNNFLSKLLMNHLNENVLVLTHSGTIKAFIATITGVKSNYIKEIEHPNNTSIYIFEIFEDRKYKVSLFNNIDHLN